MDLLGEWGAWQSDAPPLLLAGDRDVVGSRAVTIREWPEAYRADDFATPGDTRLHLGLIPQPFCGDIRRASVYVLLLNPGLSPDDYFGEYEVPAYREALLRNLTQRFPEECLPFIFLDPQFSWHAGFTWWHEKLAGVIGLLAKAWSVSFAVARARLAKQLASLELVPYHSARFKGGAWVRRLESAALAQAFVQETVMPRVRRGDAIAIVTRKAEVWNLPKHRGVIRYSGQQARAAHLTPGSDGGSAILNRLLTGSR